MSFSTEMTMPAYIIYRDIPTGQPMDLTAPLAFFPAKDSDELFDALRTSFPHLKSHSERMGQAVIEYLLDETMIPQGAEQLPTPLTANSVNVSPWEASMQSMSDSSTWSSPDMLGLATPSFGNSPAPQYLEPMTRQSTMSIPAASQGESSPPALEQMTGVFSLSDSTQPKQRVRRKMTEAEKAEYRKRRIVKACDKCSKRKRKCHHNQPEMETVTTNANKVTKPAAQPKKPVQQQQQQFPDLLSGMDITDYLMTPDMFMPSFDDFTMLPEDQPEQRIIENHTNTNMVPWSSGEVPNWTEADLYSQNFQTFQLSHQGHGQDLGFNDFVQDDAMTSMHLQASLAERPRETQQATHTRHLHESYGPDSLQQSQFESSSANAATHDSLAWEHLALHDRDREHPEPGQQVPGDTRPPSLATMTLRLNGTKKALQAFGSLLSTRSSSRSSLQNVSLRRIAIVALAGLSAAQQLPGSARTDVGLHENMARTIQQPPRSRLLGDSFRDSSATQRCGVPNCASASTSSTNLPRHIQHAHDVHDQCDSRARLLTITEPHASAQLGDYLQTSRNSLQDDPTSRTSQQRVSRGSLEAHTKPQDVSGETTSGLTSPISSRREQQVSQSLGAGITTSKSPATELYLLKRRTPHAMLQRGNAAALLNPLLTTIPSSETATRRVREQGVAISRNTICTEGNATQVNGGAYLRLEPTAASDAAAGNHANATNVPVHTRPRGPYRNGGTGISPGPNPAAGQEMSQKSYSEISTTTDFAYITPTHNACVSFMLEDHVRRRDHFGRSSLSLASWVVGKMLTILGALGIVFYLSSLLPSGMASIALLAFVAPIEYDQRMRTARTPCSAQLWGTDAQWAVWNTSWSSPRSHGPYARLTQEVQKMMGLWRKGGCRVHSGGSRMRGLA